MVQTLQHSKSPYNPELVSHHGTWDLANCCKLSTRQRNIIYSSRTNQLIKMPLLTEDTFFNMIIFPQWATTTTTTTTTGQHTDVVDYLVRTAYDSQRRHDRLLRLASTVRLGIRRDNTRLSVSHMFPELRSNRHEYCAAFSRVYILARMSDAVRSTPPWDWAQKARGWGARF